MTADTLTELLEAHWEELPGKLGSQWNDFYRDFCAIVGKLPGTPTRRNLEEAADGLFELLRKYPHTQDLLQNWRVDAERLPSNPQEDENRIRQVCNRLRTLAQQEPGKSSPDQSSPGGTRGSSETPSTNAGKGK